MNGDGKVTADGSHSDRSSIDSDDWEPTTACCGGGCCRRGGCLCAARACRMNLLINNENASNNAGQGGHDQRPVPAHAITISPANNSLTARNGFQDFQTIGNNSYEAPVPIASPLTRDNVGRLNEQSGGARSHAQWLAQHYDDVDNNPSEWFNSPDEPAGFDIASAIEGEGMEHSIHSLHVAHDPMAESISMLSQYTSSFSRTSGSPSMFFFPIWDETWSTVPSHWFPNTTEWQQAIVTTIPIIIMAVARDSTAHDAGRPKDVPA